MVFAFVCGAKKKGFLWLLFVCLTDNPLHTKMAFWLPCSGKKQCTDDRDLRGVSWCCIKKERKHHFPRLQIASFFTCLVCIPSAIRNARESYLRFFSKPLRYRPCARSCVRLHSVIFVADRLLHLSYTPAPAPVLVFLSFSHVFSCCSPTRRQFSLFGQRNTATVPVTQK